MSLRMFRIIALVICGLASANLLAQGTPQKANLLPADELNRNLPRWLRFSGEYRARVEGFTGGAFKPDNNDSYLLSRLRLNMKVQPTSWLKFMVQGQDAHVFGKNQTPAAPPFQDTMDLRLGYVELGDAEMKAFGFRIGRQELAFGEERLVGNLNWTNTARSFDGIRATYQHGGYRIDGFAASVVNLREGKFDRSKAGNNIYGLYTVLSKFVPKATVEPYLFWRRQANQPTKTGTRGNLNFATIGFRWVGKLPDHLDYGTEIAEQTGSLGSDSVGAWAGHWVLGYTVPKTKMNPRIMAEYNYATGDNNPGDNRRRTFDQLYPTVHDKYGLDDQMGWRNIHHIRWGMELKPYSKLLVMGKYSSYWLASSRDALYNAAGAVVARKADGSAGRYVGQELDFQAMYTYSKQIQIGGGYGRLFPGTFLKKTTPGNAYGFPYLLLNYLF